MHQQKAHEYRGITRITHTAICGAQVLCGLRQSMPSSSIDNCARVRQTVPSVACGQMNRPRSRRLANGSFSSLRPDESSSLQTLGKQAKAVAVEPQQLDDIAAASAENKDVTGERLLIEHRLHLRTQAVETPTHIGHAGSD